jgi:outer membrane protein assembly factor BamB
LLRRCEGLHTRAPPPPRPTLFQRTAQGWDLRTGAALWSTTPSRAWGNSPLAGSGPSGVVYSSVASQQNDDDASEHAFVFALNVTDGTILWTFNATSPLQMFDYTVVGAEGTLVVEGSLFNDDFTLMVLGA